MISIFLYYYHYSANICRNLYREICNVLFEIPSQIVQITSHFAMRYRGNHSLNTSYIILPWWPAKPVVLKNNTVGVCVGYLAQDKHHGRIKLTLPYFLVLFEHSSFCTVCTNFFLFLYIHRVQSSFLTLCLTTTLVLPGLWSDLFTRNVHMLHTLCKNIFVI